MEREKLYPTLPELTYTRQVVLSSDEDKTEEESGSEREEFSAVESHVNENSPRYVPHGRHVDSSERQRSQKRNWWLTSLKEATFVPHVLKSVSWHSKREGVIDKGKWRQRGDPFFGGRSRSFLLLVVGAIIAAAAVATLSKNPTTSSYQDNYLRCPVTKGEVRPCIPDANLATVKSVVRLVRKRIYHLAGLYQCGYAPSPNTTVDDLIHKLSQGKIDNGDLATLHNFEKVFQLILFNPHWGIRVFDAKGGQITDWDVGVTPNDVLLSDLPTIPLFCRLRLMLSAFWDLLWSIITLGLLVILLALGVNWYVKKQQKQTESVFLLVERIMEVLKAHHRRSQKNQDLLPYLAIIHVRDMLIPPSERRNKEKVWSHAVQWIATNESRVRVENRRISGEDFAVWRWIQVDPPPTEEPPIPVVKSSGSWQGRAFEGHHSPSYSGAPSPCVRLKNMFETVKKMEEAQIKDLENAVLERCSCFGSVVHIYVDKRSNWGCIYFKMDSLKNAETAFHQLHGSWFRKRLITAKYIPEPKYYKWFPHAAKATEPRRPSSVPSSSAT